MWAAGDARTAKGDDGDEESSRAGAAPAASERVPGDWVLRLLQERTLFAPSSSPLHYGCSAPRRQQAGCSRLHRAHEPHAPLSRANTSRRRRRPFEAPVGRLSGGGRTGVHRPTRLIWPGGSAAGMRLCVLLPCADKGRQARLTRSQGPSLSARRPLLPLREAEAALEASSLGQWMRGQAAQSRRAPRRVRADRCRRLVPGPADSPSKDASPSSLHRLV